MPIIILGVLVDITRLKIIQNKYLRKGKCFSQQFNAHNLKLCRSSLFLLFPFACLFLLFCLLLKNLHFYVDEKTCTIVCQTHAKFVKIHIDNAFSGPQGRHLNITKAKIISMNNDLLSSNFEQEFVHSVKKIVWLGRV